jgi:hypothetical protein
VLIKIIVVPGRESVPDAIKDRRGTTHGAIAAAAGTFIIARKRTTFLPCLSISMARRQRL